MTRRRNSAAGQVMAQVASLSRSTPQVVAHRVARMARAGVVPSARDRQEFTGMVAEKPLAMAQSVQAMWWAGWQMQQGLWLSYWRSVSTLQALQPQAGARWWGQAGRAGLAVLGQGLGPIERKAASNARRLSRSRKA